MHLAAAPDWRVSSLSSCRHSSSFGLRGCFNLNLLPRKTPAKIGRRPCRANLIMNPDSFEVGRLIGSYGFINITSFSAFPTGLDFENSSQDLGRFRVQDVGEGSVKISYSAGFMKAE